MSEQQDELVKAINEALRAEQVITRYDGQSGEYTISNHAFSLIAKRLIEQGWRRTGVREHRKQPRVGSLWQDPETGQDYVGTSSGRWPYAALYNVIGSRVETLSVGDDDAVIERLKPHPGYPADARNRSEACPA